MKIAIFLLSTLLLIFSTHEAQSANNKKAGCLVEARLVQSKLHTGQKLSGIGRGVGMLPIIEQTFADVLYIEQVEKYDGQLRYRYTGPYEYTEQNIEKLNTSISDNVKAFPNNFCSAQGK